MRSGTDIARFGSFDAQAIQSEVRGIASYLSLTENYNP